MARHPQYLTWCLPQIQAWLLIWITCLPWVTVIMRFCYGLTFVTVILVYQYTTIKLRITSGETSYDAINDYYNTIDWDVLFADNDISVNWNIFKDKVLEGCQEFIPLCSKIHRKSIPPWWTKSVSRAILKKRSLYFKYQATKSRIDYGVPQLCFST